MIERGATSYFLSLERPAPVAPAPRDTVRDARAAPARLIAVQPGERVLWQGHAGVAEESVGEPGAPLRWRLPTSTQVLVTDRRVAYAHLLRPAVSEAPPVWPPHRTLSPTGVPAAPQGLASGELRWLWPHELRVRPGTTRAPGREASPAQVVLVCETAGGERPALVFSGGDLAAGPDADRLANLLRRSIAQFRLDNARALELSTPHARMLARLLIGPEFAGHQGGPGRAVSLAAGLWMARPGRVAPAADLATRLAGTGIPSGLQLNVRAGAGRTTKVA